MTGASRFLTGLVTCFAMPDSNPAVAQRGGNPRRRQLDLAIAATATVEQVSLLTYNFADFRIIDDLVDVRLP